MAIKKKPQFWELKKKPWTNPTVVSDHDFRARGDSKPWCADCGTIEIAHTTSEHYQRNKKIMDESRGS